jgi:hypothetical protein
VRVMTGLHLLFTNNVCGSYVFRYKVQLTALHAIRCLDSQFIGVHLCLVGLCQESCIWNILVLPVLSKMVVSCMSSGKLFL